MGTNPCRTNQGIEMERKATALLRYAKMCGNLSDWKNLPASQVNNALESRAEMLAILSGHALDIVPTLVEQIEKLSELCAELFTQKTELQILSRDLAASLRINPNATTT